MTLPDDIAYALSDGVVLCHFVNQIRPRSVQSIHVPSQAVVRTFFLRLIHLLSFSLQPKLSLAKCRRNVENFIEASRRIGVPEVSFMPIDLAARDILSMSQINFATNPACIFSLALLN